MLETVYNSINGTAGRTSGTEPPIEPASDGPKAQRGQGTLNHPYDPGNVHEQNVFSGTEHLSSSSAQGTRSSSSATSAPSTHPAIPREKGADGATQPAPIQPATAVTDSATVAEENAIDGTPDKTEREKKSRKGTAQPGSHSALFGLGADKGSVKIQAPESTQTVDQVTQAQPASNPTQITAPRDMATDGDEPPVKEANPPISGTKVDTAELDKMPKEERSATEKRMVDFEGRGRDDTPAGGMSSTRASSTDRDSSFDEDHSWLVDHL